MAFSFDLTMYLDDLCEVRCSLLSQCELYTGPWGPLTAFGQMVIWKAPGQGGPAGPSGNWGRVLQTAVERPSLLHQLWGCCSYFPGHPDLTL